MLTAAVSDWHLTYPKNADKAPGAGVNSRVPKGAKEERKSFFSRLPLGAADGATASSFDVTNPSVNQPARPAAAWPRRLQGVVPIGCATLFAAISCVFVAGVSAEESLSRFTPVTESQFFLPHRHAVRPVRLLAIQIHSQLGSKQSPRKSGVGSKPHEYVPGEIKRCVKTRPNRPAERRECDRSSSQ